MPALAASQAIVAEPVAPFVVECQQRQLAGFPGVCIECHFDPSQFRPALFAELAIAQPAAMHRAVPARQAEFLAGRYAARCALSQLNQPDADVRINSSRGPVWPGDIRGALTHSGRSALCAVTRASCLVGIDLEAVLCARTAADTQSLILKPAERELLRESGADFRWGLTLVFSAKESLFKALHPVVGQYFDFLDAELVAVDRQRQCLQLQLLKNLAPAFPRDRVLTLHWQPHPVGILTYTAIAAAS